MNISEETATALCITINNHIEALRAWERKLKQPFIPQPSHFRTTHASHEKPTLQTVLHLSSCAHSLVYDIKLIALKEARRIGEQEKV